MVLASREQRALVDLIGGRLARGSHHLSAELVSVGAVALVSEEVNLVHKANASLRYACVQTLIGTWPAAIIHDPSPEARFPGAHQE